MNARDKNILLVRGNFTPAGIALTEISQLVKSNKSCKNALPYSCNCFFEL